MIANAVKFTDQGSVRIEVKPAELYGGLRIDITDTGVGIAPDQVDHLFEKFVQADASMTRRFGGSGLGLAISQELAVAMGGCIEVDTMLGQGSRFSLILTLERMSKFASAAADAPAEPVVDRLIRVLAAEDNAIHRQVLQTLLAPFGVEPTFAVNGIEALRCWEDAEWDIVLMDIQMPEMDGVTATRAIRARERETGRARTPILAVTANAMSNQALEYTAAGMDGLVPKPIEVARLLAAIDGALADPDETATEAA